MLSHDARAARFASVARHGQNSKTSFYFVNDGPYNFVQTRRTSTILACGTIPPITGRGCVFPSRTGNSDQFCYNLVAIDDLNLAVSLDDLYDRIAPSRTYAAGLAPAALE